MSLSVGDSQMVADRSAEEISPPNVPWEAWIEEDILPDLDPVMNGATIKLLGVIRALLETPDDEAEAASRAVAEYQSYFRTTYLNAESRDGWYLRNLPENGSVLIDPLCRYSWEVAAMFTVGSLQHRRLAMLVAGFKNDPPQSFDTQDPQLLFDYKIASGTARELWDQFKITGPYAGQTEEDYEDRCSTWYSAAGFMARLLDLGVLGVSELTWVFRDLEDGLEQPSLVEDGDRRESIGWQCQAAVAAQHILIGGHVLVKEIKAPTQAWVTPRTSGTWKAWAAALDRIAGTSPEDARRGLKAKARLAHDEMVRLWPDVFEAA